MKTVLTPLDNGATIRVSVDVPVAVWKEQLAASVGKSRTAEEAQRDLRLEVLKYAGQAIGGAIQGVTFDKATHLAREAEKSDLIIALKPDEAGNLDG
ncbi:MAG: hypothetical protein AMXMBFR7_32860 [Planctomycetota bacterium]